MVVLSPGVWSMNFPFESEPNMWLLCNISCLLFQHLNSYVPFIYWLDPQDLTFYEYQLMSFLTFLPLIVCFYYYLEVFQSRWARSPSFFADSISCTTWCELCESSSWCEDAFSSQSSNFTFLGESIPEEWFCNCWSEAVTWGNTCYHASFSSSLCCCCCWNDRIMVILILRFNRCVCRVQTCFCFISLIYVILK